jgi:hypothetical protein
MKKPKVDIMLVTFAYGGNGGISMTIPELSQWTTRTVIKMKQDERIDRIEPVIISETPITMSRNKAIKTAREKGYDMVLMLDSDNLPDGYLGADPSATPFWDTAFTFAYDRLVKGIPTCIAAPYCGPPPHPVEREGVFDGGEVPYLFQWSNKESHVDHAPNKLDIMTRPEAAKLRGVYPVAALPTGCCLFTMNCFDGPPKPYFKYEWMDEDQSEKASTEDVYATRNISLYWAMTKGIDVCFATCDSWALHYKPKKVGKPYIVPVEAVAKNMREAIETHFSIKEAKKIVDFTDELPRGESIKEAVAAAFSSSEEPKRPARVLKGRFDKLGPEDNEIYVSDEDWAELEALRQKELQEEVKAPEPPKEVGLIKQRVGNKVFNIPENPGIEEAINNVKSLTSFVVGKKDAPIKAVILGAGNGLCVAAVLSSLDTESRIHAYDWGNSDKSFFGEIFKEELENGRIKADIDSKEEPDFSEQWADMTLFQCKPTLKLLERWMVNVSPQGLLMGMNYDDPEVKEIVSEFCEMYGLPVQDSKGVWAIPIGGIANA